MGLEAGLGKEVVSTDRERGTGQHRGVLGVLTPH